MKYSLILFFAVSLLIVGCDPQKSPEGDANNTSNSTEQSASNENDKNNTNEGNTKTMDAVKTLSVQALAQDVQSGYSEETTKVIKTAAEWAEVWGKVHSNTDPKPKAAEIDFSKEMVVAVFMGEKSSGGYGVEIEKVEEHSDQVVVHVKTIEPAGDMMGAMMMTQPFCMVRVPKSDKKVTFQK